MKKSIIIIISIILILILITVSITGLYVIKLNTLNNLTVSIDQVTIEELKLSYVTLNLSTTFTNPSNTSIDDLSAFFDAYISDIHIGTGSLSKTDLLPQSSSNHPTTLTLFFSDIASAVIESIQEREFIIEIKGNAQTTILFGSIPIEKSFISIYNYR
jgi:LEA14-like dessication related protein